MPVGVIIDALSVVIGGMLGNLLKKQLTANFKEKLNLVLGICSMAMGTCSIVLMKNMPAVVFAMIIGTICGLALHLEARINRAAEKVQSVFGRTSEKNEEQSTEFVTVIVLFCASGTGIYGALVSGMSGDHSILVAKSMLDLFTAMIFACNLGVAVSAVAIPQAVIFGLLFVLASMIYPLTNDIMINDFKACGGIIMLATGFRIVQLKRFNIADMIPAMVLVMPFSYLWTSYILPLVG